MEVSGYPHNLTTPRMESKVWDLWWFSMTFPAELFQGLLVYYCHIRPIFHVTPVNISMMKSGTTAGEGTFQANLIFAQTGSP
jgi:hypothetical protein